MRAVHLVRVVHLKRCTRHATSGSLSLRAIRFCGRMRSMPGGGRLGAGHAEGGRTWRGGYSLKEIKAARRQLRPYRGTSLIRDSADSGPCSNAMPRAL